MNHEAKGLGFVPGSEDERDRPLSAALERFGVSKTSGSQFWYNGVRLDQGREGACVGFSWTQNINSSPRPHYHPNSIAQQVYKRAQQLDEWQGEDYEGTSVRAGAKSCVEKGWIGAYAFTQDIKEVALWVLNRHPVVIGIDWYESDYTPTKKNGYYLTGEGEVVGGHAILVDGVSWGTRKDYFRLLNSWGAEWGYNGRAKMSVSNLERLLSEPYAVACTSTEI